MEAWAHDVATMGLSDSKEGGLCQLLCNVAFTCIETPERLLEVKCEIDAVACWESDPVKSSVCNEGEVDWY